MASGATHRGYAIMGCHAGELNIFEEDHIASVHDAA
jgi:hypothetical protein